MEKPLLKMARQLNAYDEASLMALWDKYAAIVENFEPSERWEEAVLVLGMIQAVRHKNQLFNHHWAKSADRSAAFEPEAETPEMPVSDGRPVAGSGRGKRGKVIKFPTGEDR